MKLSGRFHRVKQRTVNAVRDLRDRWLRGYCCAAPAGLPSSPGYHFWRCGLRRGHTGAHRSLNYLWADPAGNRPVTAGLVHGSIYSPINGPHPDLDRYPARTRRQRRALERWHAELASLREAGRS